MVTYGCEHPAFVQGCERLGTARDGGGVSSIRLQSAAHPPVESIVLVA